ncbi:hypothetical protein R1flu_007149 [Riccia fluitans]|uniref:Uncharacterized protein n=1 Tax=Riccia fluitans TaxID=41844 RepID=A0ABD1YYA5_9MARC
MESQLVGRLLYSPRVLVCGFAETFTFAGCLGDDSYFSCFLRRRTSIILSSLWFVPIPCLDSRPCRLRHFLVRLASPALGLFMPRHYILAASNSLRQFVLMMSPTARDKPRLFDFSLPAIVPPRQRSMPVVPLIRPLAFLRPIVSSSPVDLGSPALASSPYAS